MSTDSFGKDHFLELIDNNIYRQLWIRIALKRGLINNRHCKRVVEPVNDIIAIDAKNVVQRYFCINK